MDINGAKYDKDMEELLLSSQVASAPSNNNHLSQSPVRKRTSSYHSVQSVSGSVSVDELAKATMMTEGINSTFGLAPLSPKPATATHRRMGSRGKKPSLHVRSQSWSNGQRFNPNGPLAPPMARKKSLKNSSYAVEKVDRNQVSGGVGPSKYSPKPMVGQSTANSISNSTVDRFLTNSAIYQFENDDGLIITNNVDNRFSQRIDKLPAGSSPQDISKFSQERDMFDDYSEDSVEADLRRSNSKGDNVVGPVGIPRIIGKNVTVPSIQFGNRARLSSSGTISSIEDFQREIAMSSSNVDAITNSRTSLSPQNMNTRSPQRPFSNLKSIEPSLWEDSLDFKDQNDPLYIDNFDFNKNTRTSIDSSGHHGSEFMTYSLKSSSFAEDLEESKHSSYGAIPSLDHYDLIGDNKLLIETNEEGSTTMKEKISSGRSRQLLHLKIDRVFSSIRSASTTEMELDLNESAKYVESTQIHRAFPERFIALAATLMVEILVLLMITGSSRVCTLIGRTRYQLLIAFLPLSIAISGNCSLQSNNLTTRAVSHQHVTAKNYPTWLFEEMRVASYLGLGVGFVVGSFAGFLSNGDFVFGTAIAVAQFLSIVVAGFTGTIAPLCVTLFFTSDAGKWTAPLLTTLQDVVGSFTMIVMSYYILMWIGQREVEPWDECHV